MDLTPLFLSLKVASLATLLVIVIGLAVAGLTTRLNVRSRYIVRLGATMPLVLPPTVLGYYLLVMVGRDSALGTVWRSVFGFDLVFTWHAAVMAAAIASFPLFFMSALPALEEIDRSIINAARTLGKTEGQIFWQIKLPLAWRGIVAGASLAFARAIGDFGVTLMVAGNIPGRTRTAPLAIYDYVVVGDRVAANQLAAVTTVFGLALLFVGTWFAHRRLRRTEDA